MAKKKEGFFDGLLKDIAFGMAIEASKDERGKPDPYKAAGIAMGLGHNSFKDCARLGAMLDYQGAFDDDEINDFSDFDEDESWRDDCEEGWEYGIDSEDYSTEEEYMEALDEAKYGWRDYCIENDYDIDPYDYETEEEYEEMIDACEYAEQEYEDSVGKCDDDTQTISLEITFDISSDEEYEKKKKARHELIANNNGKVLAIKYLTESGQFLYSKAVKEYFVLPIALPDETECREYEFADIICKIAKRDEDLSLKIWTWCLEQFLPYAEWDEDAIDDMTNAVIGKLYRFPENYRQVLVHYMDEHSDFRMKVAASAPTLSGSMSEMIVVAIQEEVFETAKVLFDTSYAKIREDWKEIIDFTNEMICQCRNYDELKSMEYFEKEFFPVIKRCELGMIKDEIKEWEKEITNYIELVEKTSEKHEFSRQNAEERKVSSGSTRDLESGDYSSKKAEKILDDTEVYTYCGVMLPKSGHPYSYRTEDPTIKVGDVVRVPVGKENKVVVGKVVSVGQYARIAVPYPVEQTRFVIDILEKQ